MQRKVAPISGLSPFCKSLTPNHFSNRDGRIDLRSPSAILGRLGGQRLARTTGDVSVPRLSSGCLHLYDYCQFI